VVTKYYFAGTTRIAMRSGTSLNFILTDHLGSTSSVVNASGQEVAKTLYKAWGETRFTSDTLPTKYTYTGQYSNVSDFGLMFYNARWYDPYLNHFTQPDSIVPNPGNPQAWDRYAFVYNNPLKYTDPSGHDPWWSDPDFNFEIFVEAGIYQPSGGWYGWNERQRGWVNTWESITGYDTYNTV
jgi:RHS repeat-associated protein